MMGLRVGAGVLGIGLVVLMFVSIGQTATLEDFWYEAQALTEQTWGLAALADLYVGFIFIGIIMALTEGSLIAGLLWALPLFVLGNIWTAVWLVLRLPALAERLRKPGAISS
jgi:hypothetical protein